MSAATAANQNGVHCSLQSPTSTSLTRRIPSICSDVSNEYPFFTRPKHGEKGVFGLARKQTPASLSANISKMKIDMNSAVARARFAMYIELLSVRSPHRPVVHCLPKSIQIPIVLFNMFFVGVVVFATIASPTNTR